MNVRGVFEIADVAEADEERHHPDYAEAAVDEAPVGRYSADRSSDEGERIDANACDYAELNDPFVADGVDERTNEGNGDDQMCESEPVSAICHEWIISIGLNDAIMYTAKPGVECGFPGGRP